MNILGITEDEFDTRMRLLSAQKIERRIRGISDAVRQQVVQEIEHNSKLEGSAEGLYKDQNILRHIAKPTSAKDQFEYMMIRLAIVSHYWIQEQDLSN